MTEVISVLQFQVHVRRRSRQRNMNLSVKSDGVIRLSCNKRMPMADIRAFVASCEDFIKKRRAQLEEVERLYPTKKFLSGEKFLWKGSHLRLEVTWSWNKRITVGFSKDGDGADVLEILAPLSSSIEERAKAVRQFYRREAKRYLAARVDFWARISELVPKSLTVRGQKTLWGSCTSEGALSLNWKLMACPPDVIDYVVVHELAHLREQNHSSRFWAIVARIMPEYKAHRDWLKRHQQEITRQFGAK